MDAVGLVASIASLTSGTFKIAVALRDFVKQPSPEYLEFQVYSELLAVITRYTPLLSSDIHMSNATKSCLMLCQQQLSHLTDLLELDSKRPNTRALSSKEGRRRLKAFARSVKTLKDLVTE